MALIVQKFGGSSVANAERVMNVARIITDTYKNGNNVVVVVSAQGDTTDDLIEKAKESDVPIHRDDKLADTLSRLEIGDMIPPELYEVVAEILIFVDAMDKIQAKMKNSKK